MHAYYLSILQASLVTIAVSLVSLAVSVLFGLLGAAARLSQGRFAWAAGTAYTTGVRGIPDLVGVGYADVVCIIADLATPSNLSKLTASPTVQQKAAEWLKTQRVTVQK